MFIEKDDIKKLAYDGLVDVAKHCLHAIHHAPQIDTTLEIKTALLSGEALEPIVETLEILGAAELVLWMDGLTYRMALNEGISPVLLLIGADLSEGKSGWNCGACGFETCAEFNQYRKANFAMGATAWGPSCMLNVMNFGMVCDWACAAASKYNVENRIHTSIGLVANLLGYLEDTTCILGLSIGPLKDLWYYSRPAFTKIWDKEFNDNWWLSTIRRQFPVMFQSFTGTPYPYIKTYDKWWEKDNRDYVKVDADPEINERRNELLVKMLEIVPEKRDKVDALREKFKTG